MSIGLVARKCGMTRVFEKDGTSTPVTVLEVDVNRISQIKTIETDGYSAVQVSVGYEKTSKLTKPMIGHYASANITAGRGLWEFRIEKSETQNFVVGSEIAVDVLSEKQLVDVSGVSIGKGFAGGVKRYNFGMQDATHGNSRSHRVLGSIGQCQTPGRVFKGKKMAGHLGSVNVTIQNLQIHSINSNKKLILVKGAVPGPKGADVVVVPAAKQKNKR
jgi:large subunit ribosomal protein L3